MLEALRIIRQVVEQMPRGDPNEALPRRVRPPEGDAYMRTESPRGEIGFYIVSDGSEKPYIRSSPPRVKRLQQRLADKVDQHYHQHQHREGGQREPPGFDIALGLAQ